jgi:hypothetical protein
LGGGAMLPVVIFSVLLVVMMLAVVVHQHRTTPRGRHVADSPARELRRGRRVPKHAMY